MAKSKKKHKKHKKGKKRNPTLPKEKILIKSQSDFSKDIRAFTGSGLFIDVANEDAIKDMQFMSQVSKQWNVRPSDFCNALSKPDSDLNNIMKKFLSTSQSDFKVTQHKLLSEYYSELLKIYGKTKDQLMQMDMIDCRNLWSYISSNGEVYTDESYLQFQSDCDWIFSLIPCFLEGVIQYDDSCYIEYKIESINLDERRYFVKLTHYMEVDGIWEPGISCIAMVQSGIDSDPEGKFNPRKPYIVHSEISHASTMTYEDIYNIIPVTSFNWSPVEKSTWKDVIQGVAHQAIEETKNITDEYGQPKTPHTYLLLHYLDIIQNVNFVLAMSKPKTSRKSTSGSHKNYKDDLNPKRRIRYIGSVSFLSESVPKIYNSDTLERAIMKDGTIQYRTPAWQVRGHVRHYKNGKTVYIEPHVSHRKDFDDVKNVKVAPQTIRICKGNPESDNPNET